MSAVAKLIRRPLRDLQELAAAWTRFWFEPQDVATVALLRILAGGMILYTHLIWGLRLEEFFGAAGWQPEEVVRSIRETASSWSFWWYVPAEHLWTAHWICIAILAMFFVGFLTPVTSKLTFLIVVSYAHRVSMANFGLDQINGFLSLYLALAPCGRIASVDWLLRRRRIAKRAIRMGIKPDFDERETSQWARLATRLIQVQLCVLYTYAGIAKLKGDAWWDGNAIWMAAANLEYQSNSLLWLAWAQPVSEFLTHATVLWECTFWATVWNKRLRPYVLLVGVLMHLGIGAFMGMWTFGLVMCFAYVAFLEPDVVRSLGWWRKSNAASLQPQRLAGEWTGAESDTNRIEPADDASLAHVLYVDHSSASRSYAETYFQKYGYDFEQAIDWAAADELRKQNAFDFIILNAAPYDEVALSAIERSLARDEQTTVIVLALSAGMPDWIRAQDVVLKGQVQLREVRRIIETRLGTSRSLTVASR